MKKITKILCLILCISFLFSGCGTKDNNQAKEQKEEKKLKDDFSLNKALLKEMKIEQQKLIRDYGFAFKPYSSTES